MMVIIMIQLGRVRVGLWCSVSAVLMANYDVFRSVVRDQNEETWISVQQRRTTTISC